MITYGRKSDAIVGYMYQADIYHAECLISDLVRNEIRSPGALYMDTESVLDQWAGEEGIEREDEYTFDSGECPKVILDAMLEGDEICGECGEAL